MAKRVVKKKGITPKGVYPKGTRPRNISKKMSTRGKKKDVDINIKVRGIDKKDFKNTKCCTWKSSSCCCGGFWGFGSALAMILSYTQNSSILWAILHGIVSWFYVLYRAMMIWGWF